MLFKRLALVSTLAAAVFASCDRSTAVSMPYDIDLYSEQDCLGANYGITWSDTPGKDYDYNYCDPDDPDVGWVSVLVGTKCQIVLSNGVGEVRNWPKSSNYYFQFGNVPPVCRIQVFC